MTADERVRLTIGHYVVAIASLEAKVEELTKKIAELEQPKDKPAEG
jgi:hypothetical protein